MEIGAHVSVAKGYKAMVKTALNIGANTFQFFSRNPRGAKAKEINEAEMAEFRAMLDENSIKTVLVHAPYTMNLCSPKAETREIGMEMIKEDLRRMEYYPHNLYNLHPGSALKQDIETAADLIAEGINQAMFEGMTTTVLLETMAGKGSEVGRTFEEIKKIIDKIHMKDKIGVCLDTCHVWDAGYDVSEALDEVLNNFDTVIGLKYLKAVHVNDSLNLRGSHKDRHALIGQGEIGIDAFRRIVNHPALRSLPFYLETPTDDRGHGEEIAMLRGLRE